MIDKPHAIALAQVTAVYSSPGFHRSADSRQQLKWVWVAGRDEKVGHLVKLARYKLVSSPAVDYRRSWVGSLRRRRPDTVMAQEVVTFLDRVAAECGSWVRQNAMAAIALPVINGPNECKLGMKLTIAA